MNVKAELKTCWEIKNVDVSCNQEGLISRFDFIQKQLEVCKRINIFLRDLFFQTLERIRSIVFGIFNMLSN